MCHNTIFRTFLVRRIFATRKKTKNECLNEAKWENVNVYFFGRLKITTFSKEKENNNNNNIAPIIICINQPKKNNKWENERFKPYRLLINWVCGQTLLEAELMNLNHDDSMDPIQMSYFDQRVVRFLVRRRQQQEHQQLVAYRMQDSIQYFKSHHFKFN